MTDNKTVHFMAMAMIFIIAACTKNESIDMRWDQTGCLNPWDNHFSLDSFTHEAYNAGVYDYLTSEGITINSVTSIIDSSKMEFCYACHCKSGTVLIINIPSNEKRQLQQLAPANQFELAFY